MSKNPQTPDPINDPYAYMKLAKPKPQSLEVKSKEMGFAGELGRLEANRDATAQHTRNLAEYDRLVEPTLNKLKPFLGRGQKFVYLKTDNERLVTLWQGKFLPLGRVGVSDQGDWQVSNDRDEVEVVKNGTQALVKLLEYLAPTFKENEKAKAFEENRAGQQDAQDAAYKEQNRRLKAGESVAKD